MISESEANKFLVELFEHVMPLGLVERIPDFYHEDVIGHQHNQTFGLQDIRARFKIIREQVIASHFKVISFYLIDNLIVSVVRQQWLTKIESEIFDGVITAVYRMRQNKICELWVMSDAQMLPYAEVNKDFRAGLEPFGLKHKAHQNFMRLLTLSPYFIENPHLKLGNMEMECLYYYLNGFTAKETARILDISFRTVEGHISNVKHKFQCRSRDKLREKIFVGCIGSNHSP